MRKKLRIIRLIVTEILIMALGVLCCVMPMPWRLIVPIIIGTRSILIKARLQIKQPLPTEQIKESKRGKKDDAKKKQSGGKVKKENKAADKIDNKKAAR